jgi:chromosome segregation ATPase
MALFWTNPSLGTLVDKAGLVAKPAVRPALPTGPAPLDVAPPSFPTPPPAPVSVLPAPQPRPAFFPAPTPVALPAPPSPSAPLPHDLVSRELDLLRSEKRLMEQKVGSLENNLLDLRSQMLFLQRERDQARSELTMSSDSGRADLGQIQTKLEAKTSEIGALQADLDNARKELSEVRNELNQTKAEASGLKSGNDSSQQELMTLRLERDRSLEKLEALEKEIAETKPQVEQLQKFVQEAVSRTRSISEDKDRIQSAYEAVRQELDGLRTEQGFVQQIASNAQSEAQSQVRSLNDELAQVRAALAEAQAGRQNDDESALSILKQDLRVLEDENQIARQQIQELHNLRDTLEQALLAERSVSNRAEPELQILHAQVAELQATLQQRDDSIEKLKRDVGDFATKNMMLQEQMGKMQQRPPIQVPASAVTPQPPPMPGLQRPSLSMPSMPSLTKATAPIRIRPPQ